MLPCVIKKISGITLPVIASDEDLLLLISYYLRHSIKK